MIAGCAKPENESGIDAAEMLTQVKTTQYFDETEVSSEHIEKILAAGVNAPSAMNTQPWHFTAITDDEATQKLANAMGSMKPPVREYLPSTYKNPRPLDWYISVAMM